MVGRTTGGQIRPKAVLLASFRAAASRLYLAALGSKRSFAGIRSVRRRRFSASSPEQGSRSIPVAHPSVIARKRMRRRERNDSIEVSAIREVRFRPPRDGVLS
ncbi:hypothetical protein VNO77_03787 [Canavalia gladiata]|uniref:Uncharacterized protein n=1 Tax=Canavalia gladiata TaxID=3824 RepID=A0AAN9MW70_CANGL